MTSITIKFPKNNFYSSFCKVLSTFIFVCLAQASSHANDALTCNCKDTVDIFVDGATGFTNIDPATLYDGTQIACNYDSIGFTGNSGGTAVNCNNIGRSGLRPITLFSNQIPLDTCSTFVRISGNCACWDLNSDGIAQSNEDINLDGRIDFHDCIACWDLDRDGRADIEEDTNGDFVIDNNDCCWDSNADGFNYPSEDINNDGVYDSRDCGIGPFITQQDLITFMDPCKCDDPANCEVSGVTYFHDLMTVPGSGTITAGLDIRVRSSTDFYVDVPCTGGSLSEPSFGAGGTPMIETSPGVYELEFWRPSGILPTFTIMVDGAGGYTAPAATFEPLCFQVDCEIKPIPTMGEWGLISLSLLLLIFGVGSIKERQLTVQN